MNNEANYEKELNEEIQKDIQFYKDLKKAYEDNAQNDLYFAELFNDVSAESDLLSI
jgi:hypothetical protein